MYKNLLYLNVITVLFTEGEIETEREKFKDMWYIGWQYKVHEWEKNH